MKKIIIMPLLILLIVGCQHIQEPLSHSTIEWIDILMLNDIQYERHYPKPMDEDSPVIIERGQEIGQVMYKMEDRARIHHQMQNGHATYLEKDTAIYEIKGYPTTLLVAANDAVYVARLNESAKTVEELYPMRQLVKNIYIESTEDGRRLHTFTQSAKERFLNAFYSLKLEDVELIEQEGLRIFLEIELQNGVSFRQLYWSESNVFHNGAVGNDEIQKVIMDELSQVE